ncbi:NADH-quinone oxidoreductase subunit N [Buchnera aphidicola]|uniref:NADH-quinone oxidoreductase subunit N n=1 Tax=Buchnera aphidicola TaxID=9 RepID=UPI002092F311|nr:proton-conducting transporter membrane subunit [Buchnera aphidicola]USS94247.1 hypothetical protein M3Y47_00105 [Buchnera aphidicola (Sipha maydis)]
MNFTLKNFFFISPFLALGFSIIINLLIIIIKRNFFLSFLSTVFGLILSVCCYYYFLNNFDIKYIYLQCFYDHIYSFYFFMFFLSSLFTAFFVYFWLRDSKLNREEFYLLLLISNLGGYLLCLTNDIFIFYIGMELLSFPLLGMMSYFSFTNSNNLLSSFQYFVISSISSIFALLGINLIYLSYGNLSITVLQENNYLLNLDDKSVIFLFGIIFLYISFLMKFSMFPFYFWVADIYQGISCISLMYFSNAIKIIFFVMFLKFCRFFIGSNHLFFFYFLKCIIIFSIIFGSVLSLYQKNFKRFLGYSSVANLAYLMIPVLLQNSEQSFDLAMKIYLFCYFLNSSVLFGAMHLISRVLEKNKRYLLENYEGIFWKNPVLSIAIIISSFSMAGMPFTIGFVGKLYLLKILMIKNQIFLILCVFFGSAVSLYYYFNFIKLFFYENTKHISNNSFIKTNLFIFSKIFVFVLSLLIILFNLNFNLLKVIFLHF